MHAFVVTMFILFLLGTGESIACKGMPKSNYSTADIVLSMIFAFWAGWILFS